MNVRTIRTIVLLIQFVRIQLEAFNAFAILVSFIKVLYVLVSYQICEESCMAREKFYYQVCSFTIQIKKTRNCILKSAFLLFC